MLLQSYGGEYEQLDDIFQLQSKSSYVVGTSTLNVPETEQKQSLLYLDFDEEHYGYACIEEVKGAYCFGGDCSSLKKTFQDAAKEVRMQKSPYTT